tara:strand:+ start:1345 stop:1641 length:297 start_codon:yes stop_codon:yes gene_type:complete
MPSKDHIRIDASNINIAFDNLTDNTRVYVLEEEGWVWILDHEQMLKEGKEWGTPIDVETEGAWWSGPHYRFDYGTDAIADMELGDTVDMDYLTIRRIV